MYQALESISQDLKHLREGLTGPAAAGQVARITAALEATAQKISQATRDAMVDADRVALQKIYAGIVAARRIVQQLHELPGGGELPQK